MKRSKTSLQNKNILANEDVTVSLSVKTRLLLRLRYLASTNCFSGTVKGSWEYCLYGLLLSNVTLFLVSQRVGIRQSTQPRPSEYRWSSTDQMDSTLRSAFPFWLFTLFLQVLCCYPTQLSFRKWVVPIMAGVYTYMLTHTTTSTPLHDCIMGCTLVLNLIVTASYAYLEDFPNGLRRVKNGLQVKPSDMRFTQKLCWVFDLLTNPRRIGWNQESAALPPRLKLSRWQFVLAEVFWFCVWLVIYQFVLGYQAMNPSFVGRPGGSLGIQSLPFYDLRRCLDVLSWVLATVATLRMPNAAFAAFFVGTGLSRVEDWPPLFGSIFDLWALRRVWG